MGINTDFDFESLKIKRYEHWDLYLHLNQNPNIGRCYASAINEGSNIVTEMTNFEMNELFGKVIPEWNDCVVDLYQSTRPNVLCLGNEWNHLHWHLIPRYDSKRYFHDMEFLDPLPKGNPGKYVHKTIDKEIMEKIKQEIKDYLL